MNDVDWSARGFTDANGALRGDFLRHNGTGIRKVLAAPPAEISGRFLSYDGSVWAW